MGKGNASLARAKKEKNDEFYTQKKDIENELIHYHHHLKDKIVYCNCDDYRKSKFVEYFMENFEKIGLKKLISTGFSKEGQGTYSEYDGTVFKTGFLSGNGDALGKECTEILKQADVVITNPPFSLFRKYVSHLMKYGKKFLIIGNLNAVTYKELFPLIKENKVWMGATCFNGGATHFIAPSELYDAEKMSNPKNAYFENGKFMWRVNGVRWFTNMEHNKQHIPIDLYKKYSADEYPKYDNYDAIEVSRVENIPMDYEGVMGVPISFLDKYCSTQFEIVGITENAEYLKPLYLDGCEKYDRPYVNGKKMYSRLLIRKKKAEPIVEVK